jgi:hypothetical protein
LRSLSIKKRGWKIRVHRKWKETEKGNIVFNLLTIDKPQVLQNLTRVNITLNTYYVMVKKERIKRVEG